MSLPEASRVDRRGLPVELICAYLRSHVPAGEPFRPGKLLCIEPEYDRLHRGLFELIKAGVVQRAASGKYTHTGHFPETWVDAEDRVTKGAARSSKVRMCAFIKEHFPPGLVFSSQDLTVFGPRERVAVALERLCNDGFIVLVRPDGLGVYTVPKQGQAWPEGFTLKGRVRDHIRNVSGGRAFGLDEFEHLGSVSKVARVLAMLARDGMLDRVGPGLYVRAGGPVSVVKQNVWLTVRVRQRIQELPVGETFTRHSAVFDDLGSRDAVVQALKSLVHRGELSRVAWGVYVLNDSGGLPTAPLTVREQLLQRIEALVPVGGEFTLRSLNFTGPSRVPGTVLAALAREGVVTRAEGVFLRKPGPGGAARNGDQVGMMLAHITQHLSGQVFSVDELLSYGPRGAVVQRLYRLKRAGVLVSSGRGLYAVAQEGQEPVPKQATLIERVHAQILSFPQGRSFSVDDVLGVAGSRQKASRGLYRLSKAGLIVRVGDSSFAVADGSVTERYVPLRVRVLQRAREMPAGQTFTRGACGTFDDLGPRKAVAMAVSNLVTDGLFVRVARGRYVLEAEARPVLAVRQQVVAWIESNVAYGESFRAGRVGSPGAHAVALSRLAREGVLARVSRGVYVRVSPSGREVLSAGESGLSQLEAGVTTI
jgi:predicted transcriptional regulator of viral defense system